MKLAINIKRHALAACANLCLLAAAFCPVQTVSAQDSPPAITGEWEVVQELGERKTYSDLEIKKGDDGALTATWNDQALSSVKFDNNKLSFVRTMSFGGNQTEIDFAGTLKDGVISGETASDWGSFPVTVRRAPEISPVEGTWVLKSMRREREVTEHLVVSKNDAGELTAELNRVRRPDAENADGANPNANTDRPQRNFNRQWEVANVKFDDGKLTFERKITFNDQEWVSNVAAVIDGNKISGTTTNQRGETEFTGERLGADFIGEWELEGDFQWGSPTRMLKVLPDLTARYQIFDGLTELDEVSVEDGVLKMSWEAGWGENRSAQSFSGKIEDGKLAGTITSPQGDTKVTGKKAG